MGHEDRARAHFRAAQELLTSMIAEDSADYRLHSVLGLLHAGLGEKQSAIREAKRAVDLLPIVVDALQGSFPLYHLARVYAMVGEPDDAVETLEFLLGVPSFVSVPLLHIDPAWVPIRDYARLQALLLGHTDDGGTSRWCLLARRANRVRFVTRCAAGAYLLFLAIPEVSEPSEAETHLAFVIGDMWGENYRCGAERREDGWVIGECRRTGIGRDPPVPT